jgi:uncharacterized membrane protein
MLASIFSVFVIMLAIDGVYLSITSAPFVRMIERIQQTKLQIKWVGALLSYAIMTALLYFFAIVPRLDNTMTFALGALAYGLYDSVNYALFEKYDALLALQDTVWGGVLFVLTKMTYQMLCK